VRDEHECKSEPRDRRSEASVSLKKAIFHSAPPRITPFSPRMHTASPLPSSSSNQKAAELALLFPCTDTLAAPNAAAERYGAITVTPNMKQLGTLPLPAQQLWSAQNWGRATLRLPMSHLYHPKLSGLAAYIESPLR
jgi:hypothetical protein